MSAPVPTPWASRAATENALVGAANAAALSALREIRTTFQEKDVWAWPDGGGGVHVVIDDVRLGPAWAQDTSWMAFTVNYLYPDADTYPHYVRPDLSHVDGNPLLVPFHVGNAFTDQPAVMVSRSSPNRLPGLSTAARKALSVVSFIQATPVNREQAA